MSHPEHQGVQARRYPDEESSIVLSEMEFGMLSASFEIAIQDIGDDTNARWPSAVDEEVFSLTYLRRGDDILEGRRWGVWSLSFEKATKTLVIDIGRLAIDRLEGSEQVPGSFLDASDVTAAWYNWNDYNKALMAEDCMGSFALRSYGLLSGSAVPASELDS